MDDSPRSTATIRSPRVVTNLKARSTPALDASGVAARDLARYYALLEWERPGALVSPDEACLIRDTLPDFRVTRRDDPEATLAGAVEAHTRSEGTDGYEVEVPALVGRLRGLGPVQLLAVIDLAERMVAAALREDFGGRERVREEFGLGG